MAFGLDIFYLKKDSMCLCLVTPLALAAALFVQVSECLCPPWVSLVYVHILRYDQMMTVLPSHLSPCRTSPHSISPQWSQKAGALYEWTNRQWGRIWKSSTVANAAQKHQASDLDSNKIQVKKIKYEPCWGLQHLVLLFSSLDQE